MLTKKGAIWRLFLCSLYFLAGFIYSSAALADSNCSSDYYDETTNIRYIHDGDTLHLSDGRKVRLIGINTPELARDNRAAEAFAQQAKVMVGYCCFSIISARKGRKAWAP